MKTKIRQEVEKLVNQELNELKQELEKEYPNMKFEVDDFELVGENKTSAFTVIKFDFEDMEYIRYNVQDPIKNLVKFDSNEITVIKQKRKTVWDLEVGDTYYSIDKLGFLCPLVWDNDAYDEFNLETGNAFMTNEEAEKERYKRKAIVRVNRSIDELNDGWTPDWNDMRQEKHYIFFDNQVDEFQIHLYRQVQIQGIIKHAKSVDIAIQIAEKHEDDLKLIFEVEE